MDRAWLPPMVVAGVTAALVALLGATITDIGPWYHGLHQPAWAPPDAAYGVAWTAIYALTALSGVSGWLAMPNWRSREWMLGLFALNGFLNIVWSLLFFRFHRPDWALVETVGLWLSVAGLILYLRRFSTVAALLLLPYLAWVTFAGTLNFEIIRMNGPFG